MFNFSDLSAAAAAAARQRFDLSLQLRHHAAAAVEPAPRNLYRIVVYRPYSENVWGTSSATVQVHGTSPENAREHAIALVNDDEIAWHDLDAEYECTGGDGYEYDSAECNSHDEVELLGDSEDADYDTPDENEEAAAVAAAVAPAADWICSASEPCTQRAHTGNCPHVLANVAIAHFEARADAQEAEIEVAAPEAAEEPIWISGNPAEQLPLEPDQPPDDSPDILEQADYEALDYQRHMDPYEDDSDCGAGLLEEAEAEAARAAEAEAEAEVEAEAEAEADCEQEPEPATD